MKYKEVLIPNCFRSPSIKIKQLTVTVAVTQFSMFHGLP